MLCGRDERDFFTRERERERERGRGRGKRERERGGGGEEIPEYPRENVNREIQK